MLHRSSHRDKGVDDVLDLLGRQFREHRQREDAVRGGLGLGETAFSEAEVGIRGLQMDRNRIVDSGLHAAFGEAFLNAVRSATSVTYR